MFRPIALCLALLPASAAAQSAFDGEVAAALQTGLTATADGFILPAYAALEAGTSALETALDSYCAGEGALAPARDDFAAAFLAWQRASVIQVGPIMEAEGPKRVQLWPDPKGFAARAVRTAIQAEDPGLVAPGGLGGRSIALVNFTAMEGLLYGDLAPGSYACDLTHAIAAYQAELAAGLVAAWTPGAEFRTAYDTAAAGNARYDSVDPLVRELLAGAVVYTDRLRRQRIERGFGTAPGEARAARTEAVASGLGLASLAENFRALADLYAVPGGFFEISADVGGTTEYHMLGQTAAGIADELAAYPASLADIAEEDGDMAAELRSLGGLVLFHEDYLRLGLPGSIGLASGFTSADGD